MRGSVICHSRYVTECHMTEETRVQGALDDVAGYLCQALVGGGGGGGGAGHCLHSFTFQLNLSRFRHNTYPKSSQITPDTCRTPPKHPLNTPFMHPLSYRKCLR